MKALVGVTMSFAVLMCLAPAAVAQSAKATPTPTPAADAAAKKLEAIFSDAEIPVTKNKAGYYVGVITVEDESERFTASVDTMGNDPSNPVFQIVTLYFFLGEVPKETQISAPLAKQITQWNSNLSVGKVVLLDGNFFYTTTLWLDHADAAALGREAVIGHLDAKGLRKELAPYLKQ